MRTTSARLLAASLFTASLLTGLGLASPRAQAQEAADFPEIDGLRVTELTLARNITSGQPVDPTTTFRSADGRVMVLIRLENATGAEADVRVAFERADRELVSGEAASASGVALHVPASRRYRTQARTGTRTAGRYRVVVRTADGRVLATAEYEVTA
jgi:ketosteroid isomerase-like protein